MSVRPFKSFMSGHHVRWFVFLCLLVWSQGRAAPLEIVPETVDLGRVVQNTVTRQAVMLRNTLTRPVRILQVQTDCGCTTSKLEHPLLGPGQTTSLTLSFESRNYSGKITRHIQLVTDAGMQTLTVHADVTAYPDWEITPSFVMMPPSLVEQIAQTEVRIRYVGAGKEGAAIIAVKTNQSWLQARLLPSPDAKTSLVQLTKLAQVTPGSHTAVLTLATSDEATPELKVNLVVPVASSLRVAPNPVILPRTKAGEETRASFRLFGWDHEEQPVVLADGAEVAYLGSANGEHTFEVKLRAQKAGPVIIPVKIMRGDQLQMELKAVGTIDP